MEFGLHSVGQVLVPVVDLERAKAFYRDVLGMRFLFDVPRMAFFDLDGLRLMLAEPEGETPTSSILYYRVEDIAEAHDALSRRGATFESAPALIADMGDHELWMAFFRDSEGNVLALMSEVPTG